MRLSTIGLFVMLLWGCALDGDADPMGPDLESRELLLDTAEDFSLVPDTNIRLRFMEGRLSFYAGCNSHGGPFEVRDGHLIVPGLGATEVGCESPLSEQDQWLASFLMSMPMIVLDGPRITLIGAEATLVFLDRSIADPDRPLVGTTWTIDTLIANGGASPFFPTPPATVLFADDGTLHVDTSCNTGSALYTVANADITLSDVVFTDAACAGMSMHGDTHLQALFGTGTLTQTIEANRLTLMHADLGLVATAP